MSDGTPQASSNDPRHREHVANFARSHCSAAMALLARWPELPLDERADHARALYEQLRPEMERACTLLEIAASGDHRGELLMKTLLNAVGVILGEAGTDPGDAYLRDRDRLTARVEQIAQLLIDQGLDDLVLRFPTEEQSRCIPVWGQHGAHFPRYAIINAPQEQSS